MNALEELLSHLKPGTVYRRSEFFQWSNAADRHIERLQTEKKLVKLSGGLYYFPKESTFGVTPPADHALVEAFLRDDRFLIMHNDAYNTLYVGTTQIYNETTVYNHKRHGVFKLGNRKYNFVRKPHFPKQLTNEFLIVDLINNVTKLSEDIDSVLLKAAAVSSTMNQRKLREAVVEYGGVRARKFFASVLKKRVVVHAR